MKTANKNFTSIKNDYEMTFTNETAVEPVNKLFDYRFYLLYDILVHTCISVLMC